MANINQMMNNHKNDQGAPLPAAGSPRTASLAQQLPTRRSVPFEPEDFEVGCSFEANGRTFYVTDADQRTR
jgi:hypothetical protein